jgi:hypothetical protein
MRRFSGGSDGNEQLTAIIATLLLVLLAIEGATLLNLQSLLTVHAFVGMLLIPVVALAARYGLSDELAGRLSAIDAVTDAAIEQ